MERRQEPDPVRQQQQTSSCVKMNRNADDHVSLQHRNLRVFSIELLLPRLHSPPSLLLSQLTTLDVGNNELMDLPGACKLALKNRFQKLMFRLLLLQRLFILLSL